VTRLNKILVALLAVQVVLAIVLLSRDRGETVARLEPLTASFEAAKVSRIQVFAKRDKTATGEAKPGVDLVKKGDTWVVGNAFEYPVDAERIEKLLKSVSGLQSRGAIATSAARHPQLGVADGVYERKVVITAGSTDHVLFIGGPAGTQRTAVRVGSSADVHAVPSRDLSAWSVDAEPRGWVDTGYFTIGKSDIAAVTIKTARGVVELDHASGSWQVAENGAPIKLAAGESIDSAGIDGLVNKLTRIDLAAPADPARDASAPTATITIRPKAPVTDADAGAVSAAAPAERVLDVVADGERYWVRERGNARAVLVDKFGLEGLVDITRDKLVKKPAPPGSAATPPPAPMPQGEMPFVPPG
jgi:hypothetical protein